MNITDRELAEFAARIAKLEAELVETRRVNDAWRALHLRSELIIGRISRRVDEVLQGKGDEVNAPSSKLPTRARPRRG